MLTCLCHIDRHSPVSVFSAVLSESCSRSSISIVCACLDVECCGVNPRTSTISLITWDTKADPL